MPPNTLFNRSTTKHINLFFSMWSGPFCSARRSSVNISSFDFQEWAESCSRTIDYWLTKMFAQGSIQEKTRNGKKRDGKKGTKESAGWKSVSRPEIYITFPHIVPREGSWGFGARAQCLPAKTHTHILGSRHWKQPKANRSEEKPREAMRTLEKSTETTSQKAVRSLEKPEATGSCDESTHPARENTSTSCTPKMDLIASYGYNMGGHIYGSVIFMGEAYLTFGMSLPANKNSMYLTHRPTMLLLVQERHGLIPIHKLYGLLAANSETCTSV